MEGRFSKKELIDLLKAEDEESKLTKRKNKRWTKEKVIELLKKKEDDDGVVKS